MSWGTDLWVRHVNKFSLRPAILIKKKVSRQSDPMSYLPRPYLAFLRKPFFKTFKLSCRVVKPSHFNSKLDLFCINYPTTRQSSHFPLFTVFAKMVRSAISAGRWTKALNRPKDQIQVHKFDIVPRGPDRHPSAERLSTLLHHFPIFSHFFAPSWKYSHRDSFLPYFSSRQTGKE